TILPANRTGNPSTRQQSVLTGIILGEDQIPLQGATVSLKSNSAISAQSGGDGNFEIAVSAADTLLVSYMGYHSKQIPVNPDQKTIRVTLESLAASLTEVVVVGYGTQKKENLTGSVSAVKGEEIAERPVSNTTLALQG